MTVQHVRYLDRADAGRCLVPALSKWKDSAAQIYALPRGGVPVAVEVARALRLPLDLLYVRKIGAPGQPELAIGAVIDGDKPDVVLNEGLIERIGASSSFVERIVKRELEEIDRRRKLYGAAFAHGLDPAGRTAIIVDDGIATGASMRVAVKVLLRRGATRVIAVAPVASPDAVAMLEAEGAEVVCPMIIDAFPGISVFYSDFQQLDDDDVIRAVARLQPLAVKDS